jgi:SAM-dependent methyltransferase
MDSIDAAQYDTFAHEYEEHAAVGPYNALYDRPATLELLGDVAGRDVFDAACGPGFYVEELLDRGATVSACDASASMVNLCRRRVGDRADVRVHSLNDPLGWLADGSIDIVLCALAYHYINDRGTFLAEARRVLRPDGRMVISTHHPTADWRRLGGSYFEVSAVTEVWSKGWEITAWRAPLTHLTNEFYEAGFVIDRLVEPVPVAEMARSHPATFEKLSAAPNFILFTLRPR